MSTNLWQDEVWMLARLVIAVLLGGIIGYERERAAKPAGVRTHGMVSLGAALFAVISLYGFGERGDPARVAAQIVSGIGFLGAGLILHHRGSVQGLTTAASVWVTAAIGLAVGVGMAAMAVVTALLVYLLLRFGPHARPQVPNSESCDGAE
jgi:putative Mg2+ transporter-C (MgtC) family protein